MAMSIVHRITGMALYFGTLLLVWWLLATASGPQAYATFQGFIGSWFGRLILFGYTWALIHHLLGGVRHLIWDLGYGFGPNEREWLTRAAVIGSIVADDRRCGSSPTPWGACDELLEIHTHAARPRARARLGARRHRRLLAPAPDGGRPGAAARAGDHHRHDDAGPQSCGGDADPRLDVGRDRPDPLHHRQRLAHEDRHAGGDRGLRARRAAEARFDHRQQLLFDSGGAGCDLRHPEAFLRSSDAWRLKAKARHT